MRGRNNKTDQGGCVDWLFGVNTGEYYSDLERYAKEFHERLPSNIFAIGSDPGGNLICLSTTGEDEGAVYFWDHEEEADVGEMPTHVNTYFIAKTFDDFLNSLFDYEEE